MNALSRRGASRIILGCGVLGVTSLCALAQDVGYFPQTTYKIVQITGETDQPRRIPTFSRMQSHYCVQGTDLGSTFEHNRHLYFLFGDTPGIPGSQNADRDDFLAWTDATRPEDVSLAVYKDNGCVHFFKVANAQTNIPLAGMESPCAGISLDSGMYVVVTTDATFNPDLPHRSVMAVSQDDGYSFQPLYDLSILEQAGHFISVFMVEVNGGDYPTLPNERCVLIWGADRYRQSEVYLAYVPSAQIADKSAIRYFHGLPNQPGWTNLEAEATSLFNPPEPSVGTLSVAFCQQLSQWIMLYDSGPVIHMRSASLPWGPWSTQPATIFDGGPDKASGTYLHWPTNDVFADSPYLDPQGTNYGGPYGPYLIPRFFHGDENRVTITYCMSTWNPYQVVLMHSDIGYPNRLPVETTSTSVTLPGDTSNGWIISTNFLTPFTHNGVPYVTSYSSHGDNDMGVAQYGFFADCSEQALEFSVHGGDAEVVLIEQTASVPTTIPLVTNFYTDLKAGFYGPVVETMMGPQRNDRDLSVRWDLRRHQGQLMRLFLIDPLARPWGFISVSQITNIFSTARSPADIYVARTNSTPPFLGTPNYPYYRVTDAYQAATGFVCATNALLIQGGSYPEPLRMTAPVLLKAYNGPVSLGR